MAALSGVERYAVRVSAAGVLREWPVEAPAAVYAEADRLADFPAGGEALVEVAQLGANGQPGGWTAIQIVIPAS